MSSRRSGILIPLFSAPGDRSWGIGDIGDLPGVTSWLAGAGQQALQLLPINEMAPSQQSPYSAISAMAIDPIFIDVAAVPEFSDAGGEASLSARDKTTLDGVRRASTVQQGDSRAEAARFEARLRVSSSEVQERDRARTFASFLHDSRGGSTSTLFRRSFHQNERPWTRAGAVTA